MNFLRQLLLGIQDAWTRLSASARINVVLAGAAAMAIIAAVAWMGSRPQYVTLSSGLNPQSASPIVDVLTSNSIPWREEGNYDRILVPMANRSQVQLLMAEANLPVGQPLSPGWEIFQESELMTNQWLQNVRFLRALQGEIQKQLNAFDFIEYSHVLLREAPDELFRDQQKQSEAAVTLKLRRSPTEREIKAIVSLISRAGGPNLSENSITIATTNGEPLWLPAQDGFSSMASSKLGVVTEWEEQRERKIQSKLRDRGYNATVAVSARVDFDEKEVTTEAVSEGAELSTYFMETNTSSSESPTQGAPGAVANVPEAQATEAGVLVEESTTEEIANYEPSITRSHTVSSPGDVVKYSVAVILEGGTYVQPEDGEGEPVYEAMDEERLAQIEAFVMAAVGEGQEPTDVVIHDQPLRIEGLAATTASLDEVIAAERWERYLQIAASAGQILLILIGFLLVRRFIRRAVNRTAEDEAEDEPIEIPEATREDLRRQEVVSEISGLASREPESVAALLRSWMTEEED